MTDIVKGIAVVLAVLAAIIGLTMGGSALGLWQLQVFGARTENVRNDIYKHSTAHVEGTVRTIRRYQIEYAQASDDASKKAIASMIVREADNVSDDELPSDLERFVSDMRSQP